MPVMIEPEGGWCTTPEIPYRGDRDYLNGADLYAASSAFVAAVSDGRQVLRLDVRYPRFTRCAGSFRLVERSAGIAVPAMTSVRIMAELDDGTILVGWYEENGQPARERRDNHERAVVAATEVNGRQAVYRGNSGPPAIEIAVYVTKTLAHSVFTDIPGKWIFTGLRSNRLLVDADCNGLEVALEAELGDRAVVCGITAQGRRFGDIFFGRI